MAGSTGKKEADDTIRELWASNVVDFSSQYDSDRWAASVATGPPKVYPQYGDIQGAWASGTISDHEHITLRYAESLYVDRLQVYETYNAGAITRIKARDNNHQWLSLWVNPDSPTRITESRIFDVPIQPTQYKTDTIRIELDCTVAGTWAEIDAVKLSGVKSRIEPPPPMSRLSEDMTVLIDSEEFSDVTFMVENRRVHAHRAILSARSEYFRAMFSKQASTFCKEETTEPIMMKDIGYEAFMVILQYLYTNTILKEPSVTSLVEVIRAADMYNMMDLRKMGLYQLHHLVDIENVTSIYAEATETLPVLPRVQKLCTDFISKNLRTVCKSEGFSKLPQLTMLSLIQICTENLSIN